MDNLSIKLTQLKLLLPEIFCEEQIDFQKFQQLFSEHITTEPERYMLNWAGKSEAYRILQAQTCKTLTPQPMESVNFDSTENIFIEGENLDVLKVLQKSYFNSIKMIYIDPPYNTGNDFVYNDNFKQDLKDYQEQSGELDEEGKLKLAFKRNNKENGHFHSKWLNMMLPRLHLAKNLLKDDGIIFISIDDNEQAQLKLLCDEVFGEENFVGQIAWRRTDNQSNIGNMAKVKEYILLYAKNLENMVLGRLPLLESAIKEYRYSDEKGKFRRNILLHKTRGRHSYPVKTTSGKILTGPWMINAEQFKALEENNLIYWTSGGDEQPYGKIYLSDSKGQIPNDFWGIEYGTNQRASLEVEALFEKRYFDFPKPVSWIKSLLSIGSDKDSLIFDFFSGSGTTAHAVMQLNAEDNGNRRFICVQLPEVMDEKSEAFKASFKNIAEISKERIRRAGKQIAENYPDKQLDIGFKVFKLTDSYFKQWQSPSAENLAQQIELFVDPVRKEATPNAMLYEILLRLGLKLTAKVRSENQVFWVSDESGQQFALLLETLSADLLDQVISVQPKKVVTLDSLFNGDDALKKNAELQMNDAGIAFFVL
ncbi:DNA methylase [Haemophilus quentini]|uniref:site-specific DNA-methyltransferase (adenine-specific) n=1 Tax=Haemophilus quentini TaxID=123834 RepID=A0ABX3BS92_9PAST|nr:type III restriction-modification system methyltransferase [Haemophilus haemolyticus M21639]OEY75572.1 DNA methylase [Haemophilus quentini]OEY77673.1 DNA methylase [Haemophilus quentini]